MGQSKHVGIVAVSAEGAALCYRTICSEGAALCGAHGHPTITMHTYPLAEYMRHIDRDDWEAVGRLLISSAQLLVNAGAEFLVCPDNTVHQGLDLVRGKSPVAWLHIAEEVAAVPSARGFGRLGVLGTRYLMTGPVYPTALARCGLAFEIPDPADRDRINAIIFDELVNGEFREDSREYFQEVIAKFAARSCDAVVLGCTEIPLLISPADSDLPIVDSTRTLARAALREAMTSVALQDR